MSKDNCGFSTLLKSSGTVFKAPTKRVNNRGKNISVWIDFTGFYPDVRLDMSATW